MHAEHTTHNRGHLSQGHGGTELSSSPLQYLQANSRLPSKSPALGEGHQAPGEQKLTVARPPTALLPSQIQAWEQMLHTGRAGGPREKPDAKAELWDGHGFKREVPGRGGGGDGASHGVAGCAGWGEEGPGHGGGEATGRANPSREAAGRARRRRALQPSSEPSGRPPPPAGGKGTPRRREPRVRRRRG